MTRLDPAAAASSLLPIPPPLRIDVSECFCNVKSPEGKEALPGTQQTHAAVLTLTAIFVFQEWVRNSRGCPRVCLTLGKHRNVSLMELLHGCASAICAAESVITGGRQGDVPGPAVPPVPPVSRLQQPLFAFHY